MILGLNRNLKSATNCQVNHSIHLTTHVKSSLVKLKGGGFKDLKRIRNNMELARVT